MAITVVKLDQEYIEQLIAERFKVEPSMVTVHPYNLRVGGPSGYRVTKVEAIITHNGPWLEGKIHET